MTGHPFDELLDAWMDMLGSGMNYSKKANASGKPRSWTNSMPRREVGDWEDKNGEITVTIDMPGVDKKDIELKVTESSVSVTSLNDDRDYRISKSFDAKLDPETVSAKLNNGVLDIKIQKAEKSSEKVITIE